jgi:hypothetical protein
MSANHILVWNARGLNSRARRTAVRDVAEQQRASIICLQQRRRGSARTFDRRTLSTQQLLTSIQEEGDAWVGAGFRSLGLLTALIT